LLRKIDPDNELVKSGYDADELIRILEGGNDVG
jgi:hypothetical protein